MRRGLRFRCYVHDNITERNLAYGGRGDNGEELDLIERHLPVGGTFVDVGANCGLFSLVAAQRVGRSGRVIAIEPNPTLIDRLRFNVKANGFDLDIVQCAVSDVEGVGELTLCNRNLGQSGLTTLMPGPAIKVPTRSLCSVLAEKGISRIDAMKIDIEGLEDRAIMPLLRSAPEALWPAAILIEVVLGFMWREGCIVALQDRGYRIAWRSAKDVLLMR